MLDRTAYPPIGDHALLADCHSAALVARDGTVDWACMRRFDRPSVFASILDHARGGHLVVRALDETDRRWRYVDGSLVLETTITTPTGVARVTDAFVMHEGGRTHPENLLVRVVDCDEGELEVVVEIAPRFDYGSMRPWVRERGDGCWTAVAGEEGLVVATDIDLDLDQGDDLLVGTATLTAGDRRRLAVRSSPAHRVDPTGTDVGELDELLDGTVAWWRQWSSTCHGPGPDGDAVLRSAIVLKGLSCAPTGAIIAAPTTSLPEQIGGERNWDYRYSWIRDATMTLEALALIGHTDVAAGFRDFLLRAAAGSVDELQIMYGPYGARRLPEIELDLEGYRGSRPVRIGNGAATQVQLDVYGHVLDATHVWRAHAHDPIDDDEWRFLREVVEQTIRRWRERDQGLWEMRGEPRHFVESKVMCWVALDRGVRIAEEDGRQDVDVERWRAERDEIRATVLREGLDPTGSHFVQSFGTDHVDASLLRLPVVGFVDPDDPVMRATVAAVREELAVDDEGAFLVRYRNDRSEDGLTGEEGAFLLCSYWLVEALALQGDVDEARAVFDRVGAVANDLGLLAEEVDVATGELLGNFPQAFTHLGVVRSAFRLAETERERATTTS